MAHYYAFCEKHKKVGDNRNTPQEAANDGTAHLSDTEGPHGRIYVKESNFRIKNGVKKFFYKKRIILKS